MSEETVEEEGGSGKVFLVLGLLLGLGLGGGGGFYYFGGNSEPATDEVEEEKEEVVEELIPISLEKVAVPIYAKRGSSRRYIGNYFIDLKINVIGASNQISVKRALPKLQHSFVSIISRSDLMREGSSTELDIDKVAQILKAKADEVVGENIIDSVTVTNSMRIPN